MTRLGRASVFLAVFAGDYAILMLINGQPTDFDVSAGVCAVALLEAAVFEYVVRLSRKTRNEHVYIAQPDSLMPKLAAGRPT
jgi:hypothetical protein